MKYSLDELQCRNLEVSTRREWVLPNGIGGYAMGTASGINTRRYHGHLVAATTPPTGRMVLLAGIDATIQSGNNPIGISANQYPEAIHPQGFHYLRSFSVSNAAVWRFKASGLEVEKRLTVHPGQNAVTVEYENVGKNAFLLSLRPLVCHRDHHANFAEESGYPPKLNFGDETTVIGKNGIDLVLSHPGASREPVDGWYYRFEHMRETERGLPSRDDLYCPCELTYELMPGESAVICASVGEPCEPLLEPVSARSEFRLTALLADAASKFVIETPSRSSIIAGYPWFTDWGRDTMISIPGLCLQTGKVREARRILADYASQIYQGLIPNRFVEVGKVPDYNTVDATLWFANAAYKTLVAEWNTAFARQMAEALDQVFAWHMRGTLFGIGVDPADGLLTQGEPGVQLTWMDAKVGDWVITPRHGKPVEINGLWINALRVMQWLANQMDERGERVARDPVEYASAASRAEKSFEGKFWHEVRGHYLDTADPADASLRPNQLIAMAVPFSPVNPDNARRALSVIARELLTPLGLRTLGPKEPGYCGRFAGTLPELDAAYHQGTVWPWLLGPYVTALVRYTGDRQEGKRILKSAKQMLSEYGLAGIAEVYDGDEPQSPGGCPWQAWSVAEILRAWVEDCQGE